MKFNQRQVNILKLGLKTGWLFASEYFQVIYGSKHLRFGVHQSRVNLERKFTINEELRFIRSIMVLKDDVVYAFDYKICEIIELTKEMKIVIIKIIAGANIPDSDWITLSWKCDHYIYSSREIAAVENFRLIDFVDYLETSNLAISDFDLLSSLEF